ncbi:MAG: TonB-dependent receptor [Bacteroidales bacterium]|nr:TonB-dependent receptor [Bacteroidales bacterium]
MRYTFIITLVIINLSLVDLLSQTVLDNRVNINYTGYKLTDFFDQMEKEYSIRFYFKEDWIEEAVIPKVSDGVTIRSILEYTLDSYKLSHIDLQQNNIILIPADYTYFISNEKVDFILRIGNPVEKGKYIRNKIEGYVYDGKTGEALVGVTVIDKKTNRQTLSGENGYYSLSLPGGITQIEFQFFGLETKCIDVEVLSHGKLDIELMEAPISLSSVTITADGGRNNVERTQMGLVYIDIRKINKLPALMGETDVIKSMTLMPGVNTSGEISAGFHVRGGNVDQNLFLVNDAPVYSTSHLFGMFSALIPGSVSAVSLHKGTQPSNFGTRASSVTEIRLKDADTSKISGRAGIGAINSSLFLEGPVVRNYCSFLFGARTTYSNWMLKKIPDIDIRKSKANFYDLICKLDFRLNNKAQLNLFGYGSSDYFIYSNKMDYAYGSLVGGISYNQFINDRLTLHSALSYSSYNSSVGYFENISSGYLLNTGIEQVNGRMEWSLHLPYHGLMAGIEGINYKINPGDQEKYNDKSDAQTLSLEKEKAIEAGIFIQDNIKVSDRISLYAGIRYSWYSKIGEDSSYIYQPNEPKNESSVFERRIYDKGELVKPYSGIEPRLGLRIGIDETSSIKLGYNITRQYQQLISNSVSTTPFDSWKSADENIEPVFNIQYSLGYFKNFLNNILETSVEVYYKTSENVLEYKNGAILTMNPAIERDVTACFSKSYGSELMIRKNLGKLSGWVSYTLSKSLIQTDSRFPEETINDGDYYPTYNDCLHDFSASINYQVTRRWTFGSIFLYATGRPVTYPEQRYTIHNVELVYYSERNAYRLPAYHRLDVSTTYEGFLNKSRKVHPSFTFSVFNVYGRNNVYSVYYKKSDPASANNFRKYGLYKLTIIGVPIPSFTFNLDF